MQLNPRLRFIGKIVTGAASFIVGVAWILNLISNLLTLDGSKNQLETTVRSLRVPVTSGYAVAAAFCVAALGYLFYVLSRDTPPIPRFLLNAMARGYQASWASPADAANVWRLCASYYKRPDQIIGCGPLKTFMEARRETALIVKSGKPGERCGLFIVFSLNRAGVRAINTKKIESAQDLKREHAATDGEKAQGLYVTNVCGNDSLWMRAVIENQLYHYLYLQIASRKNDIQWIYGRKGAPDGVRLMDKAGFEPTWPQGPVLQIWKLSRKDFLTRFEKRFGWKGDMVLPIVDRLTQCYDHPRISAVAPPDMESAEATDFSSLPITGLS